MSDLYTSSNAPSTGSSGSSSVIRSEFKSIENAFNKFPSIAGNANAFLAVNSTGTAFNALTASAALTALGAQPASPILTGITTNGTGAAGLDVLKSATKLLAAKAVGCIAVDNSNTPTANISFGNHKIVSLAAGTATGDAVEYDQFNNAVSGIMTNVKNAQLNGTFVFFITTGVSGNFVATPAIAPSFTISSGFRLNLVFNQNGNGNDTLTINSLIASIKQYNGSGSKIPAVIKTGVSYDVQFDGTDFVILNPASVTVAGALTGLTLSTAGNSGTITIATGSATDSTATTNMPMPSSMSKTAGNWAAGTGNGGLDTGSIANNTWYYFYLISNGVTSDVVFSLSPAAPTLTGSLSSYKYYRYIGAALTDGSLHWVPFLQIEQSFYFANPVVETATVSSLSAITFALTIPKNKVKALVQMQISGGYIYVFNPDLSTLAGFSASFVNPGIPGIFRTEIQTNSNGQISHICSNAGFSVFSTTLGWFDPNIKP